MTLLPRSVCGGAIVGDRLSCRQGTGATCAFSRYGIARMFDLRAGRETDLTGVVRPGCWINIIPAGGWVLMAEANAGCICRDAIQTSLALAPRQP